jgi:hypothetical protein
MYHSDGLINLHPMSVLTLRKLMEDQAFPQDLPFLPKEMLEMYDAMKMHVKKKTTPEAHARVTNDLDPDVYFKRNNSPLVTQTSARDYEASLVGEFMSWVKLAPTNKDMRTLANAVLQELGAGKSFVLPKSSTKLYNAMSEANEEEDAMLDALFPVTFFRNQLEPTPDSIQVHQYLLVSLLLYWERCSLLDGSSRHADMVKAVLRVFEVAMTDHLPSPFGDLVMQIRQDHLPHYNSKQAAKRSTTVKAVNGLPAEIQALYNDMSQKFTEKNRTLDELLPENFFRSQATSKKLEERTLEQYKILLLAELQRWSPEARVSVVIPSSMQDLQATLLRDYVLVYLSDISAEEEQFLRMPLKKVQISIPYTIDYAQEFLFELLVTLNTREMLPCIVFNFDISEVEKLAFDLLDKLEKNEQGFRRSDEFQTMLQRIEDAKKEIAAQEKTKSGKTRNKKEGGGGGDEDGKDGKGDKSDHRVDKDEFQDLQGMLQDIPDVLPYFSFARQGAGESSQKVQQLIDEWIRYPSDQDRKYFQCIKRGIGMHHAGMDSKMMALMEHLFRTHNLGVMISTTTLALGIHSPCRTVVIAGDDAQLTNVQFRQMAGRAGRRGVDFLGHVVTLGVSSKKIARLMTSKLQCLRGHTIVDPTTSLQTMQQYKSIANAARTSKEQKKRKTKYHTDAFLIEAPQRVAEDIERIHMTSFLSKCYSRAGDEVELKQRELWRQFTLTFLQQEGYVVPAGEEREYLARTQCEVVVRGLHAYSNVRLNPLNFTLVALLRGGILHEIGKNFIENERGLQSPDGSNPGDFLLNDAMLSVLATFLQVDEFGLPLEQHRSLVHQPDTEKQHAIVLPPLERLLEGRVTEALHAYSRKAVRHYSAFITSVSKKLPQALTTLLPYSGVAGGSGKRGPTLPDTRLDVIARCPFVALCGKGDSFACVDDLLTSISPLLQIDAATIPAVDFIDFSRHDASPILLNACAYDFIRVGAQKIFGQYQRVWLRDLNGLNYDDSWSVLMRFRATVMNLTSLSQYLAPASHKESGIHDRNGNTIVCCNLNCPSVRKEDTEQYHMRIIRGCVYKCSDCPKAKEPCTTYMCEACALDKDVKCRRGPDHEYAPYVEDDFVCCLEQVARSLGYRKAEQDIRKEDPWQRQYANKYATGAIFVSEPAPQS